MANIRSYKKINKIFIQNFLLHENQSLKQFYRKKYYRKIIHIFIISKSAHFCKIFIKIKFIMIMKLLQVYQILSFFLEKILYFKL